SYSTAARRRFDPRCVLAIRYLITLFSIFFFFLSTRRQPRSTLFPYTTLFRSYEGCAPRRKAAKNPSRFWLLASLRLCAKYYMRKKFALSIAILLSLLFAAASAQNRRSMAPADILRIASVREALMSSNAQWVAYTVASIE